MLPLKSTYPEFVPDQLLTSDHLNQLFEYLEEQGRLSRTNLIGIGIVCGLEIKTATDGTSITITKGCGITSEGYLVAVPEITYSKYKEFNAVQDRLYNRFVDNGRNPLFRLDELKQEAVEEGAVALTSAYLKSKVVLIFVEILEEGSKNCNPNSCDDKGINVTVNFRPLLINKKDAAALTSDNNPHEAEASHNLAELKMRRFDVAATRLADTAAIFEAYQKVLDKALISQTERLLTDAYNTFSPLLLDLYAENPFNGFAGKFDFLSSTSISIEQLINLQYYYDLFSDVLLAYEELRITGSRAMSLCCPDEQLFPRHLLLGEAIANTVEQQSSYRCYFIPSPIMSCNSRLTSEIRSLFKRLVLLINKFAVPQDTVSNLRRVNRIPDSIRITPSKFGSVALSEKSIPFYYRVAEGPDELYRHWSPEKTFQNKERRIRSYHAAQYNTTDDDIINPLLYDLEPDNFLRIEGHIGKPWQQAMQSILTLKKQYRLPFEVIALSGDIRSLRTQILELSGSVADTRASIDSDAEAGQCKFQDLESLYDTLAAELTCMLCKEMKYFYNLPGEVRQLPAPASTVPQVPLLMKCDPDFRFVPNSFGHHFEIFYNSIKNQPYVGAEVFLGNVFNVAAVAQNNNIGLALLYFIEKLYESLATDLSDFDEATFSLRYSDLQRVAEHIKSLFSSVKTDNLHFTEDVIDHLDAIIYACKKEQFTTLYRDYLSRKLYVLMLQKFAFFIRMHPGIQHKAGVTIGGTFILVYHEDTEEEEVPLIRGRAEAAPSVRKAADTGKATTATNSSRIRTNLASETNNLSDSGVRMRDYELLETDAIKMNRVQIRNVDALRDLFQKREVDASIDQLVADISDGTVIADFYLPYLCYSDCPPINFMLQNDKPEVEPVTIEIKVREYCSEDKKGYEVTGSPQGGSVHGEGVTTAANGKSSFHPTKVDLQAADQKTVVITYTKDDQTASTEVVVYKKPVSAFESSSARDVTQIRFTSHSQFAKSFEWDFGDGQQSNEENPVNKYASEGSFNVTLKVSNGVCSDSSTQKIDIKVRAVKSCLPAEEIIAAFNQVRDSDSQLFRVFADSYSPYGEILEFFKEFETVAGEEGERQIDFLASRQINASLEKWLEELFRFVLNSDLQVEALPLYNVFADLAMYISCIQNEDVRDARVPMANIFEMFRKQLEEIRSLRRLPSVLTEAIKKLEQSLLAEQKRIIGNNEDTKKPEYVKLIQGLLEVIQS